MPTVHCPYCDRDIEDVEIEGYVELHPDQTLPKLNTDAITAEVIKALLGLLVGLGWRKIRE